MREERPPRPPAALSACGFCSGPCIREVLHDVLFARVEKKIRLENGQQNDHGVLACVSPPSRSIYPLPVPLFMFRRQEKIRFLDGILHCRAKAPLFSVCAAKMTKCEGSVMHVCNEAAQTLHMQKSEHLAVSAHYRKPAPRG